MVELPGFEADDLIAAYAKACIAKGDKTQIISADKDLMQLLRPGVTMWDPMKNKPIDEQVVFEKFGVTPVLPYAPAHSEHLARFVVEGLRGREANLRKQAAAVLLPKHGIVVAALDLWAAIDALERIDWNAWCILSQGMLPAAPLPYAVELP